MGSWSRDNYPALLFGLKLSEECSDAVVVKVHCFLQRSTRIYPESLSPSVIGLDSRDRCQMSVGFDGPLFRGFFAEYVSFTFSSV